jgi:hypothetical protein
MIRFIDFTPLRQRALCLLLLGILGMALHVLAATGLMQASAKLVKGDQFVAELCTSHGVFKIDASPASSGGTQPASGSHDCCKLCAAAGPLLAASMAAAILSPPTAVAQSDTHGHARPARAVWTAHPARGPPAQA